jgi:dipeptidyl aminopeptidase/acylaminoacyl peptidase|tara:strand:+ start:130 stop:2091 length:1962 start_codon:yes stop_codon:yes gene_type:complete
MKKYILTIILLLNFNASADLGVSEDFVERFSSLPSYTNVKISPDGRMISVLTKMPDDKKGLSIFDAESLSLINTITLTKDEEIASYSWVNNERLLIQIGYYDSWGRGSIGEYFAINYDSKKPAYVFGMRARTSGARSKVVDKFSYGYVENILEDDNKHVLLSVSGFGKQNNGGFADAIRLNVYNGQQKRLGKSPLAGGQFVSDRSGTPRFAVGSDIDNNTVTMYRASKKDDWEVLSKTPYGEGEIYPVNISKDDSTIHIIDSTETSTYQLKEIDTKTGETNVVFHHPAYDAYPQIIDDKVLGATINPGYARAYWFENDDPLQNSIMQAVQAFNGNLEVFDTKEIGLVDLSKNRDKLIIAVGDSASSSKYYLYDLEKNQVKYLLTMWPEIDDQGLEHEVPFNFINSDGIKIHGYYTPAKAQLEGEAAPMIVIPHGGPHARDSWGFDPDTHIFSQAGYAVLKVNFRGSTGYGKEFTKMGFGEWGGDTQQDIIEATEWAINQGIADAEKIGIYGGSFGGYSAAMAPMLRPDLYKSSVAYIGVFDLEMLYDEGDIKTIKWGGKYLDKTLGQDPKKIKAMSPVQQAHKLEAPIIIVSGKEDQRAPIEHAYALADALEEAGKEHELIIVEKEGHGFRKPENRLMLYKKMLEHFNRTVLN